MSLLIMIVLPTNAFALAYGVTGKSTNTGGGNTYGYGCYSYNYVMSNPTLQSPDGEHVNSVYVNYLGNTGVECGWYRRYGQSNPQGFTVWMNYGAYHEVALGAMAAGQNAGLKVESVAGTDEWRAYINGAFMYEWANAGWTYGWPRVGSERKYTGDSNYGDFKELQFREGNVTWKYWNNVTAESDNDPGYRIYPDTANHKALVDNG
ncbi:MAG: hypothetical protein AUK32_06995 [Candidatus Aquicultor secundus]|nr:MAG: hypothetical protein AUK32_06995 [Candidatus Aquicultor secundus]